MPALPQLYTYKAGPIEQIVMPGENVGIWVNGTYVFYKVVYIEPVPRSDPLQVNFGAVAVGATAAVTQLNLLQLNRDEFGQFRCVVLDDFSAILYQGRADQRHKLFRTVGTYTLYTDLFDSCGHTTEFYVYEDQFAFIQAQNLTGYALALTRAIFYGFRYTLEELTGFKYPGKVPDNWTRVPAWNGGR